LRGTLDARGSLSTGMRVSLNKCSQEVANCAGQTYNFLLVKLNQL